MQLLVISLGAGVVFAMRGDASPGLLALVIVGLTIDAYYFGGLRGLGGFGTLVAYRVSANLTQILIVVLAWRFGVATVPVIVAAYSLSYLVPMIAIEVEIRTDAVLGATRLETHIASHEDPGSFRDPRGYLRSGLCRRRRTGRLLGPDSGTGQPGDL